MSGCLLAFLIVGGLFVVGALVAGFVAYRFMNSDEGKKIVSAVSTNMEIIQQAATAPGTKELRALGCNNAMVFDESQMQTMASAFGDAGKVTFDGAKVMVNCAMNWGPAPPTCDAVATTYATAQGHEPQPFAVLVTQPGKGNICDGIYAPDGKRISGE